MDPINLAQLGIAYAGLPEETKGYLLNPSAKTLGKGLNGLTTFLCSPLIMLGAATDKGLELFQSLLDEKTSKIKPENIDDSHKSLALMALNDSIYHLNDEDFREYFSNLVTGAFDKSKNKSIHPSFSTILKQMSTEDAKLLKLIFEFQQTYRSDYIPIISVQSEAKDGNGYTVLIKDGIILDNNPHNIFESSLSLISLERLGLIRINRQLDIEGNLNDYSDTTNLPEGGFLPKRVATFDDLYNSIKETDKYQNELEPPTSDYFNSPEILKGHIELTTLAKNLSTLIF